MALVDLYARIIEAAIAKDTENVLKLLASLPTKNLIPLRDALLDLFPFLDAIFYLTEEEG